MKGAFKNQDYDNIFQRDLNQERDISTLCCRWNPFSFQNQFFYEGEQILHPC